MQWFKVPPKIYFKRGALDLALRVLKGKKRAFIVTDTHIFNSGAVDKIKKILKEIDIEYQIFLDVKPDPTLSMIKDAMSQLLPYEPDIIIALGGGSPMDAAKIMWLMYEQPDVDFKAISTKFIDIKGCAYNIPKLGEKATMVCIPTTSGTGAEVTPFAIVTDEKTGAKYAIADYALTPNIAIIDPNFVDHMPRTLTAASGIDALVQAIEAYVSGISTNFTNSNALEAIKLIFRYLERSYNEGKNDPIAREKMHYAATIAGMSFANSFLGLCHSMAHNMGAMYNIPLGIANSLLIRQIIKFNVKEAEKRPETLPPFMSANAKTKYVQIADELNLGGKNDDEKLERFILAIEGLMTAIDLPLSIKEYGISEKEFMKNINSLVKLAFHNKTSDKNIIYPSNEDIKKIYVDAFNGVV